MPSEKVENKSFESYSLFLQEPHRPPSRGGNTKALHSHVITIDGERYSFLAFGSQQWAHKSDTVSFEYEVNNGYKNILKETLQVVSKTGEVVVRGNRGSKKLRTAPSRLPASRREQRD